MRKVSRESAPQVYELPGFVGRYDEIGDFTAGFEVYSEDSDPAPLFKGLPNDHCQATHWGVVLKGTLVYRYQDGSEDTIEAGEAYVALPGHLPKFLAGTEIVEFSKTDEMAKTVEVVMRNLEAAQGAS
jgi:hypothetical protein